MKRHILCLLAGVLMLFSLCSCGEKQTAETLASNVQTSLPQESARPSSEPEDSEESVSPIITEKGNETPAEETECSPSQAEKPPQTGSASTSAPASQAETAPASGSQNTAPVHRHSYTKSTVPASCMEQGYTVYACSCGHTYTDQISAALGHAYGDWIITVPPTQTAEGRKERICSQCGAKEQDALEKLPSEEEPPVFSVESWIAFAQDYAVQRGLSLDASAAGCWDTPLTAGPHSVYLERDIKSRIDRYAQRGDTAVWIWAEPRGDGSYNLYIGYA